MYTIISVCFLERLIQSLKLKKKMKREYQNQPEQRTKKKQLISLSIQSDRYLPLIIIKVGEKIENLYL